MKVAVIPARGGSKRIPQKNIKEFCGKPIIVYSINAALQSKIFDQVIVSTDDPEIAEVSRKSGADVPFVRPDRLADDHSTTIDVMEHAANFLFPGNEEGAFICCIYAAAPFVRPSDLRDAYQLLKDSSFDYAFSVTSFEFPIQRALKIAPDQSVSMYWPEERETRSQDLDAAWHDAGQFYWGRARAFASGRPLYGSKSLAYKIPRYRVQDIDTTEDWERAEVMYQVMQQFETRS